VRLCISQPRLGHWKEHTLTVDELLAFGQRKGYSSVKAQIPNLVIQAWLDSPENLVGLALKNPITKEFAVQCF
jgi:hypothetical protein